MTDEEKALFSYRQALRTLWNCFFVPNDLNYWDELDELKKISRILFQQLVINPIEELEDTVFDGKNPINLGIKPLDINCPIMIENPRPKDGNHYWDHPIKHVDPSEIELKFIDFFDWDDLEHFDLQYYRVRIVRLDKEPSLVGRDALIEVLYAKPYIINSSNA